VWLHAPFLPVFCYCSYLPLAHIYERNNMTVATHLGGSVGFYSGNVQELLDDVLVSHDYCSVLNAV
jgi:long-subunit acyl-CoA synthetase (AMP-forming)